MARKLTKNDSIYHSNVYVGKEYNDGIYHWKYIKRYKKNGKWVYEYDKTSTAYKAYQDAKSGRGINDRAKEYETKMIKSAMGAVGAESDKKYADKNKNYEKYYRADKTRESEHNMAKEYEKERDAASSLGYKLAYSVTKLVESSKKQINKGKKSIRKLFKIN